MPLDVPLVLTATVSPNDQHCLESLFKENGFEVRRVDSPADAECEIVGPASCVLLIDSGLLEMPHDSAWRTLRARRPQLGTVVRRWVKSRLGVERAGARLFLVHPDHPGGLIEAVRALAAVPPAT